MSALAVALAAFLLLGGAFVGAQTQGDTLVGNSGQTAADPISFGESLAVKFTTGNNALGYTLTGIQVSVAVDPNVKINKNANNYGVDINRVTTGTPDVPGTKVGSLTRVTFQAGIIDYTFTSSSGLNLDPNTSYFAVFWRNYPDNRTPRIYSTESNAEDSGGAAGWTIENSMIHKSACCGGGNAGTYQEYPNWISFEDHSSRLSTGTSLSPAQVRRNSRLTADQHSRVIRMNIKGSAKIASTDTTMAPPTTVPSPDNDESGGSRSYDNRNYRGPNNNIGTRGGGEPGSKYHLEGEERTVEDDGTYRVRSCPIYGAYDERRYTFRGVEYVIPAGVEVVGWTIGGTGPCPEKPE